MRKGFDGLAARVQMTLQLDPHGGAFFVFRGRRGDLIKVLWWDGQGLCLFAKRLERGRFLWPQAKDGSVVLTAAQLSMLLEGIDWRGRAAAGPRRWPAKWLEQRDIVTQAGMVPTPLNDRGSKLLVDAGGPRPRSRDRRAARLAGRTRGGTGGSAGRADRRPSADRTVQGPACPAAAHAIRALVGKTRYPNEATRVDARGFGRERSGTHSAGGTACPDQPPRERRQPVRRPLPDHLPREEIVHDPGSVCPGCGGTRFSKLGEDVSEFWRRSRLASK